MQLPYGLHRIRLLISTEWHKTFILDGFNLFWKVNGNKLHQILLQLPLNCDGSTTFHIKNDYLF